MKSLSLQQIKDKDMRIYKHLGYFNEVGDIRELSRKSADEILDYWKKGYGAFYSSDGDEDSDLIAEQEKNAIKSGDVKFTTDGKYVIVDISWNGWKEEYADAEDGDDSNVFIDIYELKTDINSFPYREETIEFHSNISKEDIVAAEKVLLDNGIDADEVQVVLQALGYALLDLELYDMENDEHSTI